MGVMDKFGFLREDAIALFEKADKNGNGGIDIAEFKKEIFGTRHLPQRPASCGPVMAAEVVPSRGREFIEDGHLAPQAEIDMWRARQAPRPRTQLGGSRPSSRAVSVMTRPLSCNSDLRSIGSGAARGGVKPSSNKAGLV